jgi:hypothetical protein
LQVSASLTLGTGMTVAASLNLVEFLGSIATRTLTSNGKSLVNVLLNTSAGTLTLQDNLTLTTDFTLFSGTIALDTRTLTVRNFIANGSGSRTINFDTGKILCTGTGDAFIATTTSNLVTTGTTRTVEFAMTANQGINIGAIAEANTFDVSIPATAGNFTFTFTSSTYRNLTFANATYTVANVQLSIYGNVSIGGTSPTFTGGLNEWRFISASATQTINTGGETLDFPIRVNGANNTLQLQSDVTIGSTRILEFSDGNIDLQSYTLSVGFFNSAVSTTRSILFGTGKIRLTGTGTVWNTSTVTNFTCTGTNRIVEPALGAAQTINTAAIAEANTFDISVPATAGNFTLTFTANGTFRNITFANATYTVANTAISIFGNLSVGGTSPTFTAGTNAWTFASAAGTQQITTNGETLDFPITINGANNTLQLQDALTIGPTRTLTLTDGTLDLQSFTLTLGLFSSSNSNTRTIAFGTGKMVFNGTVTATSWTTATVTNLTITGSKNIESTAPIAANTKTFTFGAIPEASALNFTVITGGSTGIVAPGGNINNLTLQNASYTFTPGGPSVFGNLLVSGTSPVFTSSSTVTMAATSGTKTITTNGDSIDAPIQISGVGGTFQIEDALTLGTTRTFTFTAGTLNLQSYTLTTGSFASSNSNARTLNFGTGKIVVTATGSSTPLNMATSTNFVATGTKLIEFPLNGVGTKTFAGGTGSTEANKLNVSVVAGTSGGSFSFTNHFNDITFENVSCTISPVSAAVIYGNLTIGGTNVSWSSAAVVWTFASTSGTKTIQTNGVTVGSDFTFDASGGSWQLQSALTLASARRFRLTTGAIDLNDYTLTTGLFELTSNSNVRSIDFGTGKITVTTTAGTGTTGISIANRTNFSVAGNYEFLVTGSMNINISGSEAQSPHLTVSSATVFLQGSFVNNFSALGFCDIRTNSSTSTALTVYGNFSVEQNVFQFRNYPPPVAIVITFAATSGTKTITSNGAEINATIIFDGAGGTWQFADNFTQQLQVTSGEGECYLTLTRGTLDINGKSVRTNAFISTTSNTRALNFGTGGILRIIGYDSVWFYAWNVNGSGLSISETNSFISFDATSDKTMNVGGGSAVYPTIRNSTGSTLKIYTSNYGNVTFKNLDVGSTTTRFEFQSSYTFYFTNFGLIPPVGVNAQIYSISSGSQSTLSQSSGIIDCQRLQIKDSNATGGASWYAGTTSVDQGNNSGWIFQDAPQASGNMLMLFI